MEGAGRFSCTRSPRGGAASAIETGRTEEKPLALPASPQTASRCPQGFLPSLDITAHHGANGSAASPAVGCPGSRVSQDLQHLSVGTGTCGLGWARRSGVKCSGSTGCSGMRTLRSKPGIVAWSGSCPSLRKTRAIEIHVKCHSFQLSTQTFNASCQQGRFYLQKGGQLGLQFLPSPRHTCTCPRAGHISQHAEPAPRSAVPIPGAALCQHWEAVSPVLGHRAAASSAPPACTKGSPSALLFLWLPVLLCY